MLRPDPGRDRPERVRCHAVHSRMTQDSQCQIRVELEWTAGNYVEGEGAGTSTPHGILRAGAAAGVEAVSKLAGGRLSLDLRGVKIVRAFDTVVVIVALRGGSEDRNYELIGSTAAPDGDLAHGAVLAVLDATNRILERYAPERGG